MSRTIWKYELTDEDGIEMPMGSVLLDVQFQFGNLCFWVSVDPEAKEMLRRRFVIVPTGGVVEQNYTYLKTLQQLDGQLVWHVLEVMP